MGRGGYKWENCGSETFVPPPPPPQDRVKRFVPPPPFKVRLRWFWVYLVKLR